ncbi:MAG: Acryloyl-CoA reductase electron transfer subunit beta [Chloroflexi bacterium]|nr:Acryloyl-CoA reductase electron transfer subunit beta [Chloroflexota bacterium]
MTKDIYVLIEHVQGKVADISYIMLAAARELAEGTGGEVVGILLGHEAQGLAETLAADKVLYGDHPALAEFTPDAYQKVLEKLIPEKEPRAVLFGSTTIGADVVGTLSSQLDIPLVDSCVSVSADSNVISQICGGKIMVESALEGTTSFIAMIPGHYKVESGQSDAGPEVTPIELPALDDLRVTLRQYIEPEIGDVDITQEDVLIGVGRGIQTEDNIEWIEELADLLGAEICASRPIVDQGWLPTSRMVGKSGQSVKPKLYLSLGISGAPEHVEGMAGSEMVIAVNMDPDAPIFDVAKYGVEFDLFDLIDPLMDKIEETS